MTGQGRAILKNSQLYRSFYAIFVDIFKILLIIIFRMDTQTEIQQTMAASLGKLNCGKVVVGARQIRKALVSGKAYQVFLAKNADPALTEPIAVICQTNNVEYAWVKSMTDLGHACGIEVGAAAAAAVR